MDFRKNRKLKTLNNMYNTPKLYNIYSRNSTTYLGEEVRK